MKLVVLVGLPGSGKTTWLRASGLEALSSDAVRGLLTGDETHQGVNRVVFRTLRSLARARKEAGSEVTYIDSTALTRWERRCWVRFAELNECEVEAVWFDVDLEECLRRNRKRERVVPEEALRRMAARMEPPRIEEGFGRVTRVSEMRAR